MTDDMPKYADRPQDDVSVRREPWAWSPPVTPENVSWGTCSSCGTPFAPDDDRGLIENPFTNNQEWHHKLKCLTGKTFTICTMDEMEYTVPYTQENWSMLGYCFTRKAHFWYRGDQHYLIPYETIANVVWDAVVAYG